MQRRATRPLQPGFFGSRTDPAAVLASAQVSPRAARISRRAVPAVPAAVPEGATAIGRPERNLLRRATLGASAAEYARLSELGYAGWLEEQLDPDLDDGGLEQALRDNLEILSLSPREIYQSEFFYEGPYTLMTAALYRAVYSPRQLFEAACVFWSDHFSIDLFGDTGYFLKLDDDREVLRAHAFGRFPDLLRASAHSPAMLAYLTNDSNNKDFPNQNYARELMELHTLGADNGYTQQDVEEVARCFTGWGINYDDGDPAFGTFYFDAGAHDDRPKRVLGQRIPGGGGIQDGETVLSILAAHPNTAQFIARKMLRFFWGYEPPQRFVNRVAQVYRNTGGDLRAMMRVILQRRWMDVATPKLKRPFHFMVSALRVLFAGLDDPSFVLGELELAGHLPYAWSPPNGYPDARGYWGGFYLPRWNFATDIFGEDFSGARFDLDGLGLNPERSPQALAGQIDLLLAGGALSEATRTALRQFLRAAPRTEERVREALGLALASPDFQDF